MPADGRWDLTGRLKGYEKCMCQCNYVEVQSFYTKGDEVLN